MLRAVAAFSGSILVENGISFLKCEVCLPVMPKNPIYASGKLKQFTSASGIISNDHEAFH